MLLPKKIYYTILNVALIFPWVVMAQIENPIKAQSFQDLINGIVNVVIGIALPVAAVFLIYAGFLFVTARGSEEQLNKAKTTLFWTVIGIAVLVGAKAIAVGLQATIEKIGG